MKKPKEVKRITVRVLGIPVFVMVWTVTECEESTEKAVNNEASHQL